MKNKLSRGSLTEFRSTDFEIDESGGRYGAGKIENFAVITSGPALGHGVWIDDVFVEQVSKALESSGPTGTKSRFTHPDMSSDGLAKGLGRVVFSGQSGGKSIGTLHFWKSARKAPEGDLAGYILQRAQEDGSSLGASISFMRDLEAEEEYLEENLESGRFQSPDPRNENNLRHARLSELRAVDIVDDPAANPDGLFYRDDTFRDAENLFEYLTGDRSEAPELVTLGLDSGRIASFVDRFLSRKGLSIMKTDDQLNETYTPPQDTDEPKTDPAPVETPVEDEPKEETETVDVETPPETPETPVEDEPKEETPETEARALCATFVEEFGAENGARWFAEGLDLDAAREKYIEILKAENEELSKQLKAAQESEPAPLSSGDVGSPDRNGFASIIGEKLN